MNGTVSGHQHRLDRLTAIRRQRALLDHDETVLLAAIAADPQPYPGDPLACEKDWVREEVAALLLLAPVTAGARLHTATRLVTRLPQTVELMGRGELPGYYATRLVEATEQLSDAHAALVETRVLPRAPLQTFSQFAAAVRRAVLAVDPRTAAEKHARSRPDRKVVFTPPGDDGMVELWALLPADLAAELKARVDALANSWKGLDDRTPDQRRADALCSLGAETAPVTARVNVTVALSTLLDLDDQPGDLDGDPVAAAVARAVAFDPTGRWRKFLVDDGGRLIDVSTDTYRPPVEMERFVDTRDGTCQFPTCQRRAVSSDKHHLWSWFAGGPTCPRNLIALCSRHHHLRHDANWKLTREPDGTAVWTSPTGRTYRRPPPEPLPY